MNPLKTIEIRYTPRFITRLDYVRVMRYALMQFSTHTKHPIVRTVDCNLPQVGHSQCLTSHIPRAVATAISRRVCAPSLPQVCLKNNIRTYKHFDTYHIDCSRYVWRDANDNLIAFICNTRLPLTCNCSQIELHY